MTAQIYVATNIVKANRESGENKAAIIVSRNGALTAVKQVDILDGANNCVARVIQTERAHDVPHIYIEAGPLKLYP